MLALTNNNITAKGAASVAKGALLAHVPYSCPLPLPHAILLVWGGLSSLAVNIDSPEMQACGPQLRSSNFTWIGTNVGLRAVRTWHKRSQATPRLVCSTSKQTTFETKVFCASQSSKPCIVAATFGCNRQ